MKIVAHQRPPLHKLIPLFLLLLLLSSLPAGSIAEPLPESLQTPPEKTDDTQDLYLHRSEHYVYLNALQTTDIVHVHWAFPPDYAHQTPVYLEIHSDTTDALITYQIIDDPLPPNKLINFTLQPLQQGEQILLHFSCWVLINTHDYENLPKQAHFPRKHTLPYETYKWLRPTNVTQVNHPLIRQKARHIRGLKNDMIRYAERVAFYIKWHRYPLFIIQLNLGVFFNQDALTTLRINGENIGRSHLACALFRTKNIPARVLLAHNDQGFWTQMHYMLEYYVPSYGWVLLDSTKGQTPYEPHRQIINRICHPEDEDNTKKDYIIPYMKGEERWLWIDTPHVEPYYVDCQEGSKSQLFPEGIINTDHFTADYAFFQTRYMFTYYQQYLGANLSTQNKKHFQNATYYQTQALQAFSQEQDIMQYITYIHQALSAYQQITH